MDVEKTNLERMSDALHLLMSYFEMQGHPYPARVHRFLQGHSEFVVSVLLDPNKIAPGSCAELIEDRFKGSAVTAGMPVVEGVVSGIEDLEAWITTTY
jgi:hypothetical protein